MLEDTVWLAALTPVAEYALTPAAEVWLPSIEMAAPGLRKAALLTSTRARRTAPGGGGGGCRYAVADDICAGLALLAAPMPTGFSNAAGYISRDRPRRRW